MLGHVTWVCSISDAFSTHKYLSYNTDIRTDDQVWEDPEVIRPERWLEQPDAPMFTYGLGYRMCAGSLLANRELYLIFMRLINSFKIEKFDDVDHNPVSGMSDPTSLVAMPRKYRARFVPRNEAALRKSLNEFVALE